ncbi:redox-sensing transcriptional repressor Rex [Anoxybacter fermentans]|uniref:Redox-sensing transcriptional repressor Rex n=1 Tax=Anoxybacter fermentans TaxID=1323375 RepID=A0A3S9T1C7_9FIRM|nr:redox-sensing transcriptional repressor Rex [Anoxybacter fermentans]AZR74222.1 redox-sensing transcriptional repressor Rex [Anoxybacter fermentans]
MKGKIAIPRTTIERLPLYYRCLAKLDKMDIEVISSKELGERIGVPSTQVRKDLSYYGEFGRRGVGYEVKLLLKNLERILGLNNHWPIVLVGAGNLGRALVNYEGFRKLGLEIKAVLDTDLNKIGNSISGITVQSIKNLKEVVEKYNIKMGIIAVPAASAQQVADQLVSVGIKAIWNFAPTRIIVPEDVKVKNEDLSVGIIGLVYHLARNE